MSLEKLKYKIMIKKQILFIMALISSLIVGCNSDSDESGYFSNDNAIVSFSLQVGMQKMPVKVYSDSLVLNIPEGYSFIDVKADYVITERSTLSPDPATITDWSTNKEFVLTAPDGKTKKTYLYKAKVDQSSAGAQGFYSLNSQAEVDEFAAKKLTKVLGISINGTTENPITDLSGLNSIVEIEYQLNINGFQGTELNGLTKLERVANIYVGSDNLEVFRLDALKEVNNANIGFKTGSSSSTTPKLKSVNWANLQVIHNSLNILALTVDNFLGFSSLKSIGGEASLRTGAKSFSGLDNLESVYNLLLISGSATSMDGLGKLTTVTREFQLSFSNALTSLNGLNLTSVKYLNINNCSRLADVTALKNIEELDVLFLSGLTTLKSLEGLHNLKRIKEKLELNSVIGLTSLDGLRSLEGVGSEISFRYNRALKSYCGISTAMQSFKGNWYVLLNGYNPTLEQVKTTCEL